MPPLRPAFRWSAAEPEPISTGWTRFRPAWRLVIDGFARLRSASDFRFRLENEILDRFAAYFASEDKISVWTLTLSPRSSVSWIVGIHTSQGLYSKRE